MSHLSEESPSEHVGRQEFWRLYCPSWLSCRARPARGKCVIHSMSVSERHVKEFPTAHRHRVHKHGPRLGSPLVLF
jgi:hypothetical protein